MFRSTVLPFGEWLPDQATLGNPAVKAKNVIPAAKGYLPVKSLESTTNAMDATCLGAIWARDSDSNYYVFTGDAEKLYLLSGQTFTDVSKSGGYTVDAWEFVKWGDQVIAAAIESPTQTFTMGTSTDFADLGGSPPQAAHIAVVRDFIVLGNIKDGSDYHPRTVQWGGYNSSTLWTPSQSTQSDSQELFGKGGDIKRVIGGEYGVILQEHSIWRMTYVGPPLIFQFDEIERDRGCLSSKSVAVAGQSIYYLSHDGFYLKQGNNLSQPIGAEKIDRFFFADYSGDDYEDVVGAIDRTNKTVIWSYPSREAGGTRILIFRWDLGRWSYVDQELVYPLEYASPTYSLDDLDSVLADIDSASIPVDSALFRGGNLSLAGINDEFKLATFSGNTLPAVMETGELQEGDGKRTSVKSVRPLIDGGATVAMGTKDNLSDPLTYGLEQSANAKGEANFRTSARFHRVRVTTTGNFDHAVGAEVFYRREGRK